MPDNNHNNNHNNNNNSNTKPAPRPLTDLTKNGDSSIESIRGAQNLIRQFGKQVEPALYALLCDTQSETRATVDKALKAGGPAASAVLTPLLTSQYGIPPVIATMVSAVALQAIATVGQEKLCRALAETSGPKTPSTYKPPATVNKPTPIPAAAVRHIEPREPEDDEPKPVLSSIRPTTTVVREPPPPKPAAPAPKPEPVEEAPAPKAKRTRAVKAEPKAKAKTKAAVKKKAVTKKKAVAKKKTAK